MTRSELLRAIEQNKRLEAKLRANAEELSHQTAILEQLLAETPLSSIADERSMFRSKMEIENARVNKRVRISATMTSDSDAKRALLEAGITSRDVAALLGVGHSTVNAWCTGARSIPRAHVDRLREKHRIPAKVWPKIAG